MKNRYFFISITFLAIASNAQALKMTGAIIYDRSSNYQKILYQLERKEVEKQGEKIVEDIFKDPHGNIVARESFVYKGEGLLSYQLKHFQLGVNGKVSLNTQTVTFTLGDKTSEEDFQSNVLSKNQVVPHLYQHWNELMAGETISIRLLVVDRAETVGFKFFKEEETTYKEKQIVSIKMKPSNFIIAALVDPLIFKFEKDAPHKLLEVNGRVVPKQLVDDKWKDLDAVTVYQYQ